MDQAQHYLETLYAEAERVLDELTLGKTSSQLFGSAKSILAQANVHYSKNGEHIS